jgi:guanosine-3',5'-bis(diphosphate) 3'-pyrophosphohydrolase
MLAFAALNRYATNQAIRTILAAARFAAEPHAEQKRKGLPADSCIKPLIEVAHVVSIALPEPDANLIIATILRDTIEDAGVTQAELARRFGDEVADLAAEVTDDKSLEKAERKRLRVENAPMQSLRTQVIKLADLISNMR